MKATAGVLYGHNVITVGAASTIQYFDGTQPITGTLTNQTAGNLATGLPAGIGGRFNTSLVVVTAGTAVSTGATWYA